MALGATAVSPSWPPAISALTEASLGYHATKGDAVWINRKTLTQHAHRAGAHSVLERAGKRLWDQSGLSVPTVTILLSTDTVSGAVVRCAASRVRTSSAPAARVTRSQPECRPSRRWRASLLPHEYATGA